MNKIKILVMLNEKYKEYRKIRGQNKSLENDEFI